MFNRTSLQSHIPPVSVTGQSRDIFLTTEIQPFRFHKINSWRQIKLSLCSFLHPLWNTVVKEDLGRRVKKMQNGKKKRQFQKITLLKKDVMKHIWHIMYTYANSNMAADIQQGISWCQTGKLAEKSYSLYIAVRSQVLCWICLSWTDICLSS